MLNIVAVRNFTASQTTKSNTVVGHIRDTCQFIEMPDDWPTPPPHMHRIAKETGTDKYVHQFTMFYPHLLDPLRERATFNMLEIGVYHGESLALWQQYFPRARIFGADKSAALSTAARPKSRHGDRSIGIDGSSGRNFTILQLDQHNRRDVQRLANYTDWSLVIDDGSHKPTDQLVTFMEFFPLLRPYGVYIIEDIQTSYFARGYGRGYLYNWNMLDESAETDVVARFLDAVHMTLNRKFQCYEPSSPVFSAAIDARIGSITFLRNAVAVVKAPAAYRFKDKERLGKSNCREERFTRAKAMPRSVEVVLSDSAQVRRERAQKLREPADAQPGLHARQVPADAGKRAHGVAAAGGGGARG